MSVEAESAKGQKTARLAWSLTLLATGGSLVAFVVGIYLLIAYGDSPTIRLDDLLIPIPTAAYAVVGALIAVRHPRNPIGWIFIVVGWLYSIDITIDVYKTYSAVMGLAGTLPPLAHNLWVPRILLPTMFVFFLFPNGTHLSRRWQILYWSAVIALAAQHFALAYHPGPVPHFDIEVNPDGIPTLAGLLNIVLQASRPLLLLGFVGSFAAFTIRLRCSRGVERQQMKWLSYAIGLTLLTFLFNALSWSLWPNDSLVTRLSETMLELSVLGIAVATGIAILRYRLYDIDFIINRTLVYGALTVGVTGLYVLMVGGAGLVIQTNENLAGLLITVVLVSVLYRPVHALFQRNVDRLMFGKGGLPLAPSGDDEIANQEITTILPATEDVKSPSRWIPIARWIAWSLVVAYVTLAAVGITLQAISNTTYVNTELPLLIILVILVGVWIVTGALIISRHPHHPVGWLLCAGLFTPAIDMFAAGYAAYDTYVFSGSLPGVDLALVWLKLVIFDPFGLVAFTLIVLLFPDGRFPSSGWRKVAWTAVGTLFLILPLQALEPGSVDPLFLPIRTNPLGVGESLWAFLKPFMWTAFATLALCYGAAFVSLIIRLRRSRGDVQQQIKWVLFPVGLYGIFLLVFFISMAGTNEVILEISIALGQLAAAGMVIAIAFAIFKYRLYDIDIIINRTLVYGSLTASVVVIYVLLVGGLGTFFQAQGNLIIALLATGIVAVLFQPLRERLQQAVNRLIYGERDDPVEALSRLGRQLETAVPPDKVLSTLVETIAQTLKLPYVAIHLPLQEGNKIAAEHGQPVPETVQLPLVYQGEDTGQLVVGLRSSGSPFSLADMRLLRNIARQSGTAVHAVRLTDDLLRSRQQLITAREEERRRLQRDLHDGLGATLAALNLEAAILRHSIRTDPEKAEALVDELRQDILDTIEEFRHPVYELRPPALDQLGLAEAVRAQAEQCSRPEALDKAALQITVEAPEALPPLPAAVEVAAYRIAQEAMTNVVTHARAGQCVVRLEIRDSLRLEVVDDGIGMANGRSPKKGLGLNSMRERAEELGGACLIESVEGGGTRVLASLPLLKV